MKVKVIERYKDLQIGREVHEGEILEVSEERAEELAGTENKAGIALVKMIETDEKPPEVSESDTKEEKKPRARKKKDGER